MMSEMEWKNINYLQNKGLIGETETKYGLCVHTIPSAKELIKDYLVNVVGGTINNNGKYHVVISNSTQDISEVCEEILSFDFNEDKLKEVSCVYNDNGRTFFFLPDVFEYGYEWPFGCCISIFDNRDNAEQFIDEYEEKVDDFKGKERISPELSRAWTKEFRRKMKDYREGKN